MLYVGKYVRVGRPRFRARQEAYLVVEGHMVRFILKPLWRGVGSDYMQKVYEIPINIR